MNKNFRRIFPVLGLILFLFSCKNPVMLHRTAIGEADYGSNIVDVGTNPTLSAPQNFRIENNGTGTEPYLLLKWDPVEDAESYRVYRAVYPAHTYTSMPQDKAFKRLIEIKASDFDFQNTISFQNDLPDVPLRRYAYRVTSVNSQGESVFSETLNAHRNPMDAKEALQDIDYTIHFAQSSINGFGAMGMKVILPGRASGNYHYASEMTNIKNQFENYADFETILNGNPSMKISLKPMGTKMNGSIKVSGLYEAEVVYQDLIGVIGGLTQGGHVKITYNHPQLGPQTASYDYKTANSFMKSVAVSKSEICPHPPASEWDESDPGYIRAARMLAGRSLK